MMINMLKCKPDVIVCFECWLIDDIKFIYLNGYTHINNNSRINISDGVVIYVVKNELKSEIIIKEFKYFKLSVL